MVPSMAQRRSRRAPAVTAAVLVSIITFIWRVERPFWRFDVGDGRERRAAVAIKGDDPAFAQWVAKVFTLPYLERYYARTYYVTELPDTDPQAAFVGGLQEALTQYETVDIFILAHSNHYEEWIAAIDPELRRKIRLVYNTGCGNVSTAPEWIEAGATTSIAHPGESESPIFFFYFLRRWTLGENIDEAIADSNGRLRRVIDWQARLPVGDIDPEVVYQATEAQCFGQCMIVISSRD